MFYVYFLYCFGTLINFGYIFGAIEFKRNASENIYYKRTNAELSINGTF